MALFPIAKPKAHSLTGRITLPLVQVAFKAVRRNRGAAGIDKVSIKMFESNRDENLQAMLFFSFFRGAFGTNPIGQLH